MSDENPGAPRIDIGHGVTIRFTIYQGEPAGIIEEHPGRDGTRCEGWVPFRQSARGREFDGDGKTALWNVEQREPLTLSPSILCRRCGNHGFIRDGKWVVA